MKSLGMHLKRLDAWQQRHRWSAVTCAVLKKYSRDRAGQEAALLTYYAFWSLFPLLLVLTTLTSLLSHAHPDLQHDIVRSVGDYFPVLGGQLAAHINGLHKNGVALIVGVLLTLYGAHGVADAFRRGVRHIWHVPQAERLSFPESTLNSLLIIVIGGMGFTIASVCTGLAATAGHGAVFRLLPVVVNLFLLFWLFTFLLTICLPRRVPMRDTRSGALSAAVGLVLFQGLGGYLLKAELHRLDAVYSYFALALGLLFWIYLQARVLYYAVTLAAVRAQHLWPRSFTD